MKQSLKQENKICLNDCISWNVKKEKEKIEWKESPSLIEKTVFGTIRQLMVNAICPPKLGTKLRRQEKRESKKNFQLEPFSIKHSVNCEINRFCFIL